MIGFGELEYDKNIKLISSYVPYPRSASLRLNFTDCSLNCHVAKVVVRFSPKYRSVYRNDYSYVNMLRMYIVKESLFGGFTST